MFDVPEGFVGNAFCGGGVCKTILLHCRLSLKSHTRNVLLRSRVGFANGRRGGALSLVDTLVGLSVGKRNLTPGSVNHSSVGTNMHDIYLLLQVDLTLIFVVDRVLHVNLHCIVLCLLLLRNVGCLA